MVRLGIQHHVLGNTLSQQSWNSPYSSTLDSKILLLLVMLGYSCSPVEKTPSNGCLFGQTSLLCHVGKLKALSASCEHSFLHVLPCLPWNPILTHRSTGEVKTSPIHNCLTFTTLGKPTHPTHNKFPLWPRVNYVQ